MKVDKRSSPQTAELPDNPERTSERQSERGQTKPRVGFGMHSIPATVAEGQTEGHQIEVNPMQFSEEQKRNFFLFGIL